FSCREYDCDLTWLHTGPEGEMHVEPATHFSVHYTLERGAFRETFFLTRSEDAPAEVLSARPFIFWSDWQALTHATSRDAADRAQDVAQNKTRNNAMILLAGAHADSGLLLAASHEEFAAARTLMPHRITTGFPLLHPQSFRMKD